MYLYKCHSTSTSLGKVERVDKEINKNDIERRECSQKSDVPHTNAFLLGFSWSSDNITVSNKKSTSKKEPINISEITT